MLSENFYLSLISRCFWASATKSNFCSVSMQGFISQDVGFLTKSPPPWIVSWTDPYSHIQLGQLSVIQIDSVTKDILTGCGLWITALKVPSDSHYVRVHCGYQFFSSLKSLFDIMKKFSKVFILLEKFLTIQINSKGGINF